MSSEKFSLSWSEFDFNAGSSFKTLLGDTTFTDVVLVSDDMKEIQAHKIILRSVSQFFRNILGKLLNQRPLLFLKGIQNLELLPIVNFIYLGRTEVAQDDLINFIGATTL